ncbi:MAG: hypothetical protein F4124_00190 [Acidimicrobiia bacterium]|nr:hypothetical protein [Acidimicrobiia bacterium]MYB75278.1 hypothetical protein [Acidimicrobiia bacterium]MYH97838.1 hypothetical protein [Acidimicrobiia bacterium]
MPNIASIIKDHHTSVAESSYSRTWAIFVIYFPAVAATTVVAIAASLSPSHVRIGANVANSLIAAFALLSAILFGLSLTVLDKAIDTDLAGPHPSRGTDRAARRLQALAANTLYTSIVAALATGILVSGEVFPSIEHATTSIGVGAMVLVGTNGA